MYIHALHVAKRLRYVTGGTCQQLERESGLVGGHRSGRTEPPCDARNLSPRISPGHLGRDGEGHLYYWCILTCTYSVRGFYVRNAFARSVASNFVRGGYVHTHSQNTPLATAELNSATFPFRKRVGCMPSLVRRSQVAKLWL